MPPSVKRNEDPTMSDDQAPVNTEENIIHAVLAQAFSPPPSHRQSVQPGLSNLGQPLAEEDSPIPAQPSEFSDKINPAPSTSSATATDDTWKVEYEAQVEAWRAQSAEAREKAQRERERWEAIRAAERKEGKKAELDLPAGPLPPAPPAQEEHEAGWETVSSSHQSTSGSTVIVSAAPSSKLSESRHEATIETADHVPFNHGTTTYPPTDVSKPDSHHDTGDESQKWEDLHSSVTSSFPSMSFPERTETPSPSRQNKLSPQPPPTSATLAVFDSSLSTRTRAKALLTSLAINMLLPFVNGVMLGFGEIFAKNVIMGWFGWKVPGTTIATTAGVGVKTPWNRKQRKE